MATSGQIQPLKIPDAVVALAQAAAKANGETEKYLPGWPLFSPPKMQLTKCGKCPREFCSSIALRRHSRVHRRALKLDKDFFKNRDHLAAFWDKLTVDQAQEILSLENVAIEETTALSILTALSSWMCKPGYASLPLTYARAGNELLDLIQTAASRLPISSNVLFAMLDEASENTCLCTNAADAACSVQKFLFDGEVEKVATELKNVVACASYILERKLVEAWSADKWYFQVCCYMKQGQFQFMDLNNAGVMATPYTLSKDGIEMQFATNHVRHFLLTHLLLDTMKKTSRESNVEGRIVNVSSEGHRFAYAEGIRFDKINDEAGYGTIGAYGQSKLANILHANELARRFKEEGVNITANSLHPGSIITNLLRHHSIIDVFSRTLGKLVLKNVKQGAATTCYVALHPGVKGVSGKYFCDSNVYEPSDKSKDAELAKKLWDFSVELTTSE